MPLTHNDPKTETEKITKYENVAVDIKICGSLIEICIPLSHLSRRSGHQKLRKISTEYSFHQKRLKWGKKQYYYVSYSTKIPRTSPLTLRDGMNVLS